jgi:hypothetical protein
VSTTLDAPQRAAWLIERRERLIEQLPRRIRRAQAFPRDVHELIVDEAIEFAAVRHDGELADGEELRALFWSACEVRVRRAREGRYDLVRAGWRRAEQAALERLQAPAEDDPLVATLAREERAMLADVLRALTPRERAVIAVKHMSASEEVLGYKKIARHLALPVGEVRAAERSIRLKFERVASAARAHEAALERKLGQLLPVPPAAETVRGRTGVWRDLAAEWLGRPFGADASTSTMQLVASGAGRGAGGALAVKLATLCIGTGGIVGAACLATGVLPVGQAPGPAASAGAANSPQAPRTARPTGPREQPLTAVRASATASPTATPFARQPRRSPGDSGQGGTGPRDQERTPASPAPANAASDGSSEFDPLFVPSQPATPAPPPAAPGGSEFF